MNWLLLLAGTGAVLAMGGSLLSTVDQIGADPTSDPSPESVDSIQVLANCATWLGSFMLVAAMVLSYYVL